MSDTIREARGARREAESARGEARGARFDQAIDRAVREMLDVEPPAGLRGRVFDRIDALSTNSEASATDSVASAFRRKFGFIALPVAAAAVIILAVLAPWRHAVKPISPAGPVLATTVPAPATPALTAPPSPATR